MPANTITFVISGQPLDGAARGAAMAGMPGAGAGAPSAAALGLRGEVKHAVRVGARRGAGAEQRLVAVPGEDVVVLHIDNGPTLYLHPETARDLMLAQSPRKRSGTRGAGGALQPEAAPNEVEVPAQLRWQGLESTAVATRGATRGFLGDVLLSAVEVVTGHLKGKAQDYVAGEIVQLIDGQVKEGVYALQAESMSRLKGKDPVATMTVAPAGAPTLVFVHGTFSETSSGFGKLWIQHPQRVRALFRQYDDRVFALDHATLGASPIENAYTLAMACPTGARLHLVTHSRGGLVAEVLARAAGLSQPDAPAEALFRVEELPGDMVDDLDAKARLAVQKALDGQKEILGKLIKHLRKEKITVDRIVRVACPARGTLLASKRFDAYMSVFKWGLDLAQVPILPELVDFIGGVAQRRLDPTKLPGVAAMVPDSPLVRWLHAADEPVPGQLRVVAGDLEGDTIGSWLKTLMADAFYWTDNDLVVQTRSMYGGAPRAVGASFVLDRGGQVTHFNYFANERTAEAVVNGLVQDAPGGWRVIGQLSYAGESATGVRGARRGVDDGKPSSDKPAVLVLPGILGSHLKVDGKRVWLGWRLVNGLKRLSYPEPGNARIEPDGPIGMIYEDLMDFLAKSHEVIEFSFDWRKPIEQEARRMGTMVEAALAARDKSGQPVRIVAHSMGGVVTRTMQLECGKTWDRMMARPGARVLMLGTPNGGSWAPMQVLSGDDTFGNTLVAVGAPFQDHEARALMAQFPGFIQLQAALLDDKLKLDDPATWKKLADDDLARVSEYNWWHHDERQLNAYRWGVPSKEVLNQAVELRRKLDKQRDEVLPKYKDKLLLVVGHADFTPDGYELGNEGLVYLNAPEVGDGRVTLANAMLPGVRTWKLDCEHGKLPDASEAFDAYQELLEDGATARLPVQPELGATRGAGAAVAPMVAHVRSRPARERNAPQPRQADDDLNRLLRGAAGGPARVPDSALRITLHNGDLKFVRQPLMLGHYASASLTGTEWVVNKLIDGTMEDSLAMGQYPDQPGTHQLFQNTGTNRDNPLQLPRPESVIVVGLGEEGKLTGSALAYTVKLAVLALAQRLVERPAGPPLQFELAATLLGSGGSGISAGQSAQLIAQGVREADQALRERNERLSARQSQGGPERRWPRVGELHLIELYLDRASEAWRALQVQTQAMPGHYQLGNTVHAGPGALRRPLDGGYRGADYDFISAVSMASDPNDTSDSGIAYTIDTKRARSEVRAQSTQAQLVRELVKKASNYQNRDTQIGHTLFKLLVPVEMEPFLGGTTEMLLELDRGTAGIPWEMLDTSSGTRGGSDNRPWAIRAKLLRKLRLADFRQHVSDASRDAQVLVIGEPLITDARYPRLAGARDEAKAVRDCLMAPAALGPDRVKALISPDDTNLPGPDAREVINALMLRDWRIVHVSGHGEPPERVGPEPKNPGDPPQKDGNPRGVVLSNGSFLGPREIHNMRVVPELVFVNCCHLAGRNLGQLLQHQGPEPYDRARFASTVAEELIKIGVRCVVAAGWAVEDGPAMTFATTFYDALLRGERFIDAVARAREAAWTPDGNTWAAYQCYGDPEWVFHREGADAQRPEIPLGDRFASVVSPTSLTLALETLVISGNFQGLKKEEMRARIRHLEARFAPLWGGMGAVAEAFGVAWAAAGDRAAAIAWYERALAAEDGSASLKASEQLGNLRVRQAWAKVNDACKPLRKLKEQLAKEDRPPAETPAELSKARAEHAATFDEGRKTIGKALELLSGLVALQPTMERLSLCGSAHKRLVMLEREAGQSGAEADALQKMRSCYQQAEDAGRDAASPDLFYPALNRIAADCALHASTAGWAGLDLGAVAAVRQALADRSRNDPEFWSVVGQPELALYEALAAGKLAERIGAISAAYEDLHGRVKDPGNWGSVLDQLDFVLPPYLARASRAEVQAARKLRAQVAGFTLSAS